MEVVTIVVEKDSVVIHDVGPPWQNGNIHLMAADRTAFGKRDTQVVHNEGYPNGNFNREFVNKKYSHHQLSCGLPYF